MDERDIVDRAEAWLAQPYDTFSMTMVPKMDDALAITRVQNSNDAYGDLATTVSEVDGALQPIDPDGSFVNDPSPLGEQLGAMLSRFVDAEMDGPRILRPRCHDCAFLRGTEPNKIAGTLMTALKCVIEKEPFYCHAERGVSSGHLCAGWEALIDAKGPCGRAPWEFLEHLSDGALAPRAEADDAPRSAPARSEGTHHNQLTTDLLNPGEAVK